MSDGRSSATFDATDGKVAVAVILGFEPLSISDKSQYLNIDEVILQAARHIQNARKRKKVAT